MPERDHHISLTDAVALVRSRKPLADEPRAWLFSRSIIDEILAQKQCAGMRVYMAGNGAESTVVLVGTDHDHNDISDGVLAEYAWPCPPVCPDASPLG